MLVNGKKAAEVKRDGKFTLGKLTTGAYKVEVKSKNVHFEAKTLTVDMANPRSENELAVWRAKSFDVCGRVKIAKPSLVEQMRKSVQVVIRGTAGKSTAALKDDLTFCVQLEPGAYVATAELSDSLAHSVRLVPLERRVTVVDAASFDVDFEQLEARLDGQIRLIGGPNVPLPTDLIVQLKSIESTSNPIIPIQVGAEFTSPTSVCCFLITPLPPRYDACRSRMARRSSARSVSRIYCSASTR